MAKFVSVCKNVKVEVGAHYSKFLKLTVFQKSIALSVKVWQSFKSHVDSIDKCLTDEDDYRLQLSQDKYLQVAKFRDRHYITFCEDFIVNNDQHTKYVSLDTIQWFMFKQKFEEINRILDYDVIHCGSENDDDDWRIHPARISTDRKKRLVPRMCSKTFVTQLYVFILTNYMKAAVKRLCYGCSVSSDDPYMHMTGDSGCQSDWSVIVHSQMENAQQKVSLADAIASVNTVMGWNMELEMDKLPSLEKLRNIIVNHKALSTCDPCRELLPIYWKMYDDVFK